MNKLQELITQFETSLQMDDSIEANTIEELADLGEEYLNEHLSNVSENTKDYEH